ncbi:hypothetical protein D3C85_794140 [compost metagenome]
MALTVPVQLAPIRSTMVSQDQPVNRVMPVATKQSSIRLAPTPPNRGTTADAITSPTRPPAEKFCKSLKFMLAMADMPSTVSTKPMMRTDRVR